MGLPLGAHQSSAPVILVVEIISQAISDCRAISNRVRPNLHRFAGRQ